MERRNFLKKSLIATGGLLFGGAIIRRLLNNNDMEGNPHSPVIEIKHQGNKKKVLAIMSSGTRFGNTDRLTDAYIKGVIEAGHSVTKVYLGSMAIQGCRGCGACQRFNNRCVVQDGMQDIYPLFAECDTIVMASPLYFWTITAQLKAFIERLYAVSVEDKYPKKNTVLLMTAGDDEATTFDQPKGYYSLLNKVLGWNEVGMYCAGGCTGCEELAREIDKKHLDNVYKMGLRLYNK